MSTLVIYASIILSTIQVEVDVIGPSSLTPRDGPALVPGTGEEGSCKAAH
jgi:hypothetical protein